MGFNNPQKAIIQHNKKGFDPVLGFDPAAYKTLKELPPVNVGCDTVYSISDTRFKHLWQKTTWDEVIKDVPAHVQTLSLTGGEPSLWQTQIAEYLDSEMSGRFPRIIFETNASVALTADFMAAIQRWQERGYHWVWSNSPKLSCSGESRESSIKPEVLLVQQRYSETTCCEIDQSDQYIKFVTDGTEESLNEIYGVIAFYRLNGVKLTNAQIYLMPMACNKEQQDEVARSVADLCIKSGYTFCYRLQNALWSNIIGT
jgi:organic radical activating enzyme